MLQVPLQLGERSHAPPAGGHVAYVHPHLAPIGGHALANNAPPASSGGKVAGKWWEGGGKVVEKWRESGGKVEGEWWEGGEKWWEGEK